MILIPILAFLWLLSPLLLALLPRESASARPRLSRSTTGGLP